MKTPSNLFARGDGVRSIKNSSNIYSHINHETGLAIRNLDAQLYDVDSNFEIEDGADVDVSVDVTMMLMFEVAKAAAAAAAEKEKDDDVDDDDDDFDEEEEV